MAKLQTGSVSVAQPIDPILWLQVANSRRPKLPATTEWFDGTTHPTRPGWYERHFTDSMIIGDATMQYWDGKVWVSKPTGPAHWRQVGDYPAWRGQSTALPLKRCAAARDGDCTHSQCPQLRDNEPHASGRHCPLDTQGDNE